MALVSLGHSLPLLPQRTLQKQSVVYGGKSTIRDRSSGTASSVAFTPLQVPSHHY
jgi:hypothetical protein